MKWDDNLMLFTGVSHSHELDDGTVISIGQDVLFNLHVYKIEPSNPNKRIVIATIPHEKFGVYHDFGMTKEYAVIFEPPFYVELNIPKMMIQNVNI